MRRSAYWLAGGVCAVLVAGVAVATRLDISTRTAASAVSGETARPMCPLAITPEEVDFGRVSAPGVYEGHVTVTNVSKEETVIRQFTKSCSCTTISADGPISLKAGQHVDVKVVLRLNETDHGGVRKALWAVLDDGRVEIPVRALGAGKPQIRVSPKLLEFGKIGSWEGGARQVAVRCPAAFTNVPRNLKTSDGQIDCLVFQRPAADTVIYQVAVPRDYKEGLFSGFATIVTEYGEAQVNFQGEKVGSVYSMSDSILFRKDASEQETERCAAHGRIVLRHVPQKIIALEALHSSAGRIEAIAIEPLSESLTRVDMELMLPDHQERYRGEMQITVSLDRVPIAPIVLKWWLVNQRPEVVEASGASAE